MGPIFVKEPPNRVDFSNGTGAVIECQARGNPQPDVIWVRSDGTAVGDVPGLRQVRRMYSKYKAGPLIKSAPISPARIYYVSSIPHTGRVTFFAGLAQW